MRKFFQLIEPGALQVDIVVLVHGIEADNLPAIRKQSPAQMKADETGCPGDKNRPA